jgi:hypothetical protein
MRAHTLVVAGGTLAAVGWLSAGAFAHKPITSPFTFYDDVLPITAVQCGACHSPDGVAPMSLLSHDSAVPWGESIRLELVAGHMPPWAAASPPDRFRDVRRLSARELNVLLTWAAGGTPPGDTPKAIEPIAPAPWPLGTPHETLALPTMDLPADVARITKEWVLPVQAFAGRRLTGVDLRPGMASVVRNARIAIRRTGGAADAGERVIGLWVPADQPALLPAGAGWTIGPGSELVVRVSYRKRWDREREPASDQSTIGLYFATADGGNADALALREGRNAAVSASQRLVALWPEPAAAGASLRIETVAPSGARAHVATLSPRAGWERRYWLKRPLELAAGTMLEVTSTWPAGAQQPPAATALLGVDLVAP